MRVGALARQLYGLVGARVVAVTAVSYTHLIEQELFLSQNTVKTHVRHLYAKLGVHSKTDVIALFEE